MNNNNCLCGLFDGCNSCVWIIIIALLILFCNNNNNCGCGC